MTRRKDHLDSSQNNSDVMYSQVPMPEEPVEKEEEKERKQAQCK